MDKQEQANGKHPAQFRAGLVKFGCCGGRSGCDQAAKGTDVAKAVSPRGFARERVADAALALFAEHGVNGTSFKMIADRLGVSKTAVYYQFHSKDDLVHAIVQPVFDDIERVLKIAEAMPTPQAQREVALSGLVELAVRHRGMTVLLNGDPAVHSLVNATAAFGKSLEKLDAALLGPEPNAARRVAMSMVRAGICGSATDERLNDVTDEDLHRELLECAQVLLRSVCDPVRETSVPSGGSP